jgi:hypothetical protein
MASADVLPRCPVLPRPQLAVDNLSTTVLQVSVPLTLLSPLRSAARQIGNSIHPGRHAKLLPVVVSTVLIDNGCWRKPGGIWPSAEHAESKIQGIRAY